MDSVSRDRLKKMGLKRLFNSFRYAVSGIKYAVCYEQNIVVHFIAMGIVIVMGLLLKISVFEWLICFILFGLVISTELINSSIEAMVDLMCPREDPLAKIAKDTASGAVFVLAIVSIICGLIIFLPKLIGLF